MESMPSLDKHTLRRLARSTLNELQQNQHEKASLVCVGVQSPSGLALVPCALSMVDLSGQLRCCITQINKQTNGHPWYRKMFGFVFLAPYARTTRYEETFLPKGKKRPHYYAGTEHFGKFGTASIPVPYPSIRSVQHHTGTGNFGKIGTTSILVQDTSVSSVRRQYRYRYEVCLLYTSPSPRDLSTSRMPSSA